MIKRAISLVLILLTLALISRPDGSFASPPLSDPDYERVEHSSDEMALPSNITVPEGLKLTLNRILKRSATFRRQCRRLGIARNMQITIKVLPSIPNGFRALSVVRRGNNGQVLITLQTIVMGDYTEVLGHEFEHALEQAEGLNLEALAGSGDNVYKQWDGTFETKRAVLAGRIVAREFRK
jgi:hypothetical protein